MLEAARDGRLGTLAIFGANPVLHYPDRALVQAALDAVPFVVVSELFMTETAARAKLILPACSAFEKSGTTTDLAGDVLPVLGSVVAPGEAQADGDMLVLLAQALNVALPDPADLETLVAAACAKTPRDGRAWSPAPSVPAATDGLRLIVESAIFAGGGTSEYDARVSPLRARPRAKIHPQTAADLHIAPGDLVDIVAAGGGAGRLRGLSASLSERVRPGTVSIIDGLPGAAANALGANDVHVMAAEPVVAVGA
jgi:anaerobic selenocysteine-containing dehydrogenase